MSLTVIVGMNNPLSTNPSMALYPAPVNCAGWRLWQMLAERCGASSEDYRRGFDRRNLLPTQHWDRRASRAAAEEMLPQLVGRRVVLLGAEVRAAFRLPPVLVVPVSDRGVTWRQLPHPSGRCRWYNDPKNRAVAGALLEEELRAGEYSCR